MSSDQKFRIFSINILVRSRKQEWRRKLRLPHSPRKPYWVAVVTLTVDVCGVTWLWDKQDNSPLLVLQKATIWALMEGQTLEHVHRDRTCTCFCAFISVHSPSTLHLSIIQRSIIHSVWWARQIWNVTSVLKEHFCAALNFLRHMFCCAIRKCKRSSSVVSLQVKLYEWKTKVPDLYKIIQDYFIQIWLARPRQWRQLDLCFREICMVEREKESFQFFSFEELRKLIWVHYYVASLI